MSVDDDNIAARQATAISHMQAFLISRAIRGERKRCADIAAAAASYYVSKIDNPADVGYWHGASASAAAIATEIEKE